MRFVTTLFIILIGKSVFAVNVYFPHYDSCKKEVGNNAKTGLQRESCNNLVNEVNVAMSALTVEQQEKVLMNNQKRDAYDQDASFLNLADEIRKFYQNPVAYMGTGSNGSLAGGTDVRGHSDNSLMIVQGCLDDPKVHENVSDPQSYCDDIAVKCKSGKLDQNVCNSYAGATPSDSNPENNGRIADADKPRETETETDPSDPDLEADSENSTRPPADEQVAQAEADYKMYESQVNECKKARDKAEHCCGSSAMGCMMGFKESDDMGAVTSVGAMLIQQVIATRQISQGVQGNCSSQEGLANFSAGVNGAMAMSCHGKRTTCDSTCEPLRESIKAKKLATCTPGRKTCEGLYDRLISETQKHINKCDSLIAQEVAMGTQAVATVASGQMARLCQDVVAASPPPVAPGVPGNDLCTDPTDLSNPYCRQQFCSQPGSINLPECQGQQANTNNKVGGGGGPTSFGSASFGTRGGNADLGGADDGLGTQQPGTGNHEIGSRSAVTAQAGGSGGVPGGGATGGGGAGYGGGGARQKGLKTDILGGVGGGSGYSVSRMGVRGGGGYSNPVGRGNGRKKNKPFDLKKYLPKKDAKRKLAGLSGKRSTLSSQLAGKHENIWSRVSNKYKEMCILNRLYCPRKGRR